MCIRTPGDAFPMWESAFGCCLNVAVRFVASLSARNQCYLLLSRLWWALRLLFVSLGNVSWRRRAILACFLDTPGRSGARCVAPRAHSPGLGAPRGGKRRPCAAQKAPPAAKKNSSHAQQTVPTSTQGCVRGSAEGAPGHETSALCSEERKRPRPRNSQNRAYRGAGAIPARPGPTPRGSPRPYQPI